VVALTNFLLREDVSLDIIYSSPLLRAFNTITPYAQKKSLKIYTDIRLKEIFLGLKEEKPVGELFSNLFHENPFYYMDTG
jgi:broad specificity phosphatase PhoE